MKQNWKQLLRRTESAILVLLMLLSMVEITPAARAASDTVESPVIVKQADGKYTVTLNFRYEGTADSVSIKGGIPGIDWGENQAAMNNTDGVWSYTFTDLTSGIYPYKFYTSNDEWIADPQNNLRDGDDNGLLVLDETPVIAYHDEDNTYRVTLRYADTAGTATSVEVRGDGKLPGTTWGNDSISMSKTAADSNIWLATFENVQPGSCAYKFVINGTDWMADPNVLETDSDGNSLLTLGKPEFTSPEVNGRTVTFRYYAPNAGNVYLVGEMNGWNTSADLLIKDSSGVWSLTKALSMGVYGYKFFVDGDWKADPVNPDHIDNDHAPVDDPEGNSKLVVSGLSEDSLTAQKGGSITLPETLTLIDKDGKSSSVTPNYTLSSNPAGITLNGKTLYVSDDYTGDRFVVNAEYEGYTSQIVIYVLASPTDSVMMLFHYNRPDNNYEDWDLWFWPDGGDGRAYSFDSNGTAIVAVPEDSTRFGYIIRYGGDSWAGKDIDSNQFIDIPEMVSGIVHIYAKSGVPGYSKGYDTSAKYEHKPIRASLNKQNNITAILTGKLADEDLADFKILDSDGRTIQVLNAEGHEASNSTWVYVLTPAENLTPGKVYRLQYKEAVYEIAMLNVYSSEEFENAYTYEGNDLGAVWTAQKTTFRVWAPTATAVTVNLYRSGTEGADDLMERLPMTADVCGTWVAEKAGDLNGTYYTYTAKFSGQENETVDPYARAAGVNGKRSMVIDLASTNPAGWEADKNPNAALTYNDAIIYELHVRDLSADESSGITNAGKFLGLTESGTKTPGGTPTGLDHIKALGITHLHLLPVFDYSSSSVDETNPAAKYNWGYDPVNYNVPEGSYSTDPYHGEVRVKEMKQMVKTLHDNGISVVMDVVYNHVHDADTFSINMLVPGYFSRTYEDGTYSDDSICGNDTASERSMVSKFIVDSVKYWADEYHIDGFRFDLVGLIDTQTINQIVTEVHKTHPDAIFYGEGWDMVTPAAVSKEGVLFATQKNSPQTPNFAYFSDTIRDALKGSAFNDSTGYVSGASGKEKLIQQTFMGLTDWCATPAQTINYASCHDNNTLMDRITLSTPDASIEDRIRMNNLAAAVYLTAEGIPLVHAGEEMLRTKPDGNGGFVKDSYESPDSVNSLKWSELDNEEYRAVYEYYKGLIAFRKAHAALRLTNAGDVRNHVKPVDGLPENVVAFQINGGVNGETSDGLYVIFNPNNAVQIIPLPAGMWDVFINGDKAGTEVLETVEGTAVVAPVSALVLVKHSTASKPTTPDIPSIPDTPSTPDIPSAPGTTNTPSTSSSASVNIYAVTVEKTEHGKVTSNSVNASSNSTVTLTIAPDSGYALDTLTVTDSRGNEIKLTAQGGEKYTFTMPARAVTVKATFAPLLSDVEQPCDGGVSCPSYGFADLGTVGTWYHEAVDYALRNGLMNGYSSTMFGPDDNLSRAQLAQILYNMEGKPAVTGSSTFADVVSGQWYAPAITWAAANGIVGGYGDGRFGPDDNITREQLAVMLWRYAGSPAATDKELHFTDADEAGGWALEALRWAAENGILNGYGDGRLNPGGLATRAQVAQMLKNFIEN